MTEDSRSETSPTDASKVRELVRRVLRSGGTDLAAVEELVFLQDHDDALGFTATTDRGTEVTILQDAFDAELLDYIRALLADDRLTHEEATRLRSSVMAASGRFFDPEVALAPYEDSLRAARP